MGFNITVLACHLKDKDILLNKLQLVETSKADPDNEGPRSFGVLGDYYLIWENWRQVTPFDEVQIANFSTACPILGCFVSESTMWSMAALFEDGRVSWSVSHTGETAIDDIQVVGSPPSQLAAILEALREEAAEDTENNTDYLFDGPTSLFKMVTGFKHDEVHDIGFFELESLVADSKKKPIWKFWT
jgi:hypothetical protein